MAGNLGESFDVVEALRQFKQDLTVVDEAVWARLSRLLAPHDQRAGGDSRAALLTPGRPLSLAVAGPDLPHAAGTAPALGVVTWPHLPASPRDEIAVERLQETARAGVIVTLELAELQGRLEASGAFRGVYSPHAVLVQGAHRVCQALEHYLIALDKTHYWGDLEIRFPWAADAELDPTRIRQTLTLEAEALRSGVQDLPQSTLQVPSHGPASGPAAGGNAVGQTAEDIAQRVAAIAETMDEARGLAEHRGAPDLHDAFGQAWAAGMHTYDRLRSVAATGRADALPDTFELAARQLRRHVEAACALQAGRPAISAGDLQTRLDAALDAARHLVVSAQYLDVIGQAPGSTAPSVRSDSHQELHDRVVTITEFKAAVTRVSKSYERATETIEEAQRAMQAVPGVFLTLVECAGALRRGRSHLGVVETQAALLASAPDVSVGVSRLERIHSDVNGVAAASSEYEEHFLQALKGAQAAFEAPGSRMTQPALNIVSEAWANLVPETNDIRRMWASLRHGFVQAARS